MDALATRKLIRSNRRNISPQDRLRFNQTLCQTIINNALFINAKTIAGYLPHDGEADITPVLEQALKLKKTCYLPCITDDKKLLFRKYTGKNNLIKNAFNILEPQLTAETIAAEKIDLVLMPLVGFDEHYNRLGMGGGYYDRTFEFTSTMTEHTHPLLLGCAYAIQQLPFIKRHEWDVPLDGVATEQFVRIKSQCLFN